MKINGRQIGECDGILSAPFIIAELGVNHDGCAKLAREMVVAAAHAGADAVKFQLFRADHLMSKASRLAAYQARAGEADPVEMLRRLELTPDDMRGAIDEAHRLGIGAIVTVFSTSLVADAERLGCDAYKTASPDIVHKPLLEALASTGKPVIVSTGASTLDEVARAAGWLRGSRARLAMLQCVSSYPTPIESAEFGGIRALSDVFAGPVGYSDHTDTTDSGATAVLFGATILEKHLTHDQRARGPDHAASLDPGAFRAYVDATLDAWRSLATLQETRRGQHRVERLHAQFPPLKRVLPCEQDVRELSRQSLVTTRDLPVGHVVRREDLTIKRPGTGIEPWRLEVIIGMRTARPVEADMPLTHPDLVGLNIETRKSAGRAA